MVLKQNVIDAFRVLELDPATTTVEQATTAYKKLALKHHPDRNYGDPTAKERFQEIGEAWSICQRHFEYPASSQVPEPGAKGFGNYTSGRTYTAEDEVPLDEFEAEEFFRFMFEEVFLGRFSHSKGQRYRSQRAGAGGGGIFTFSGGFAEAQKRQAENKAKQARETEAFRQRVREFEREQAEEQAEIDRLAREEARDRARLASAQNSAFQLGKEGKGAEMRSLIEKFDLDVTKPRKLNTKKDAKMGKDTNFETMLHAAAGSCDVALIDWLLGRGADPSALDPSRLTPFHVGISGGNTPVARHLISLYRNTKSTDPRYQSFCDGCHPSKAAKDKDGSTPLQLAIRSGKLDMVELLLKDATVHNVERCWAQLQQGEHRAQIADILLTKNGFTPPEQNGVAAQHQAISKKAMRKLKQAEEEKKANEEKARRLAEEEENRLKKQARREKAAKEEAERQAKRETEERKRIEEAEEEERRRQAKQQEQARRVAMERARREAEETARREAIAREKGEEERRQEAAREAKRKLREEEAAAARQKAKEVLARQQEMEAALARQAKAEAEAARVAQREAELRREEEQRVKAEKQRAKQREEQLQRENERHTAEVEARLQQEQEDAKRIQQEQGTAQARQEAIMRRRAEQSARDKARNQRIREERARAQALESVTSPIPLTNSPLQSRAGQDIPTATKPKRIRSKRASSSGPSEPPPVPLHTRPKVESSYSRPPPPPPPLLSPPMTPEDLQTIPIPEELFQYEPPVTATKDTAPSSPALDSPSRGQGVRARSFGRSAIRDAPEPASVFAAGKSEHIGNGIICRFLNKRGGCARGAQCAFSHVATPRVRRTDLEEELAKKNQEIERMRAELAAAKARASQHA